MELESDERAADRTPLIRSRRIVCRRASMKKLQFVPKRESEEQDELSKTRI